MGTHLRLHGTYINLDELEGAHFGPHGSGGQLVGITQSRSAETQFEGEDVEILRRYFEGEDFDYTEYHVDGLGRVIDLTPPPTLPVAEPGPTQQSQVDDFVMIDGKLKRPLKDSVYYRWSLCGVKQYHLPKDVYHALANVQFRTFDEAMKAVREALAKLGRNDTNPVASQAAAAPEQTAPSSPSTPDFVAMHREIDEEISRVMAKHGFMSPERRSALYVS